MTGIIKRTEHDVKKLMIILGAALLALSLSMGGATAAKLITGHDIKDGSVGLVDLGPGVHNQLDKAGPRGPAGPKGATGAAGAPGQQGETGADGTDGMLGAYYSVASYDVGDTNAGAIATVACNNVTDVAISGGVQMIGVGGHNSAVGSSFPGRMDWSTNTPKPDRLDGWVVQFDATTAPEKVKVWALCLPGANIPVEQTYTQSD